MYKRNTEVYSRNQYCHGKAKRISVALVIWDSMRIYVLYCHLWPVTLYHIIPHYLINGRFSKEKKRKVLNIKRVF